MNIDDLRKTHAILLRAESAIRQGSAVYTARHLGYVFEFVQQDEAKRNVCFRIMAQLRKGEHLDAHDEIKSLVDKIRNEIGKLESVKAVGPDQNPPNP